MPRAALPPLQLRIRARGITTAPLNLRASSSNASSAIPSADDNNDADFGGHDSHDEGPYSCLAHYCLRLIQYGLIDSSDDSELEDIDDEDVPEESPFSNRTEKRSSAWRNMAKSLYEAEMKRGQVLHRNADITIARAPSRICVSLVEMMSFARSICWLLISRHRV